MPLVDLYGHENLRDILLASADAGTLPASLLFHGQQGIGKQRLALWLGQLLLCENRPRPCGSCQNCHYTSNLTHPDLHWYFPRPRLKDAEPDLADVREDYEDAVQERANKGGIYAAPSGSQGIFVSTIRAILREAVLSPAMARHKVFIIGDADRMVSQEGSDQAANAFLKMLEEPNANTTIILTSSEPGALLPTIRSRAVSVRVQPLLDHEIRAFLSDPAVVLALGAAGGHAAVEKSVQRAAGAPGALFGDVSKDAARIVAQRLLGAAVAAHASALHAATLSVGPAGARGPYSDALDSLLDLLGDRMRAAVRDKDDRAALAASRASDAVGRAKMRAGGNVNPMLITSRLLRELAAEL